MAATNFTPIILYHTATASAAPAAGNLNNGELAINITDGKLFYKDNGGTVQVIATKATGTIGGSTTQVQYNNAGALAGSANFTFNGTTATINTLNLTNALGTAYGGTALTTYTQGDLVYASAANTLAKLGIGANTYILTSTGSVPQWLAPSAVTVSTANNLAGGAAGSVPYQSGAGVTTFLSIGTANQVLTSSGTAPQWSSSLTLGGNLVVNGNTTLGDAAADNLTINATVTSNLIFTDNTYDIGASGATRPRNLFLAGSATISGNQTLTGSLTVDSTTDSSSTTTGSIQTDGGLGVAKALFVGTTANIAGAVTLSGGTANGVAYLDGSKVLTTGSALTFDGTNFATTGTASATKLIPTGGAATGNGMYLPAANTLAWSNNGSETMRLDSSGNLGLGVTPSAWDSGWKAIDVSTVSSYTGSATGTDIWNNARVTGATPLYKTTAAASFYRQSAGAHYWFNAASGTAGNAISFTQAMTLDASGRLVVGATSTAAKFQVSGVSANTYLLIDNAAGGENYFAANISNIFQTAGTERARIDSSGNLLVGTTTTVVGSNHIVVGSNSIQGIKNDFTNLGTSAQSFGFQASSGGVYVASMKSIGGASIAFLVACTFDNSGINMFTTSLGGCTAGGVSGTISGINNDARTYTFSRNGGTGLLEVTASSTATGTTTFYLTPLNVFA